MNVTLTPDQLAWLEAQVAAGSIPSVDEGVRMAIADLMAIAEDDLKWAKPHVDDARAAVARGEVRDGEEFLGHLRDHVSRLKSA